ncbi:MAG TPA: MFS transporter, partial [Chiayiivirga sp.]|nr:MFS transporter [Chiayiivirga sp.]
MGRVVTHHPRALVAGTFAAVATFVLFYLMTVFTLSWGTSRLGYSREAFLVMQMIGVLFFAFTIPLSAVMADRWGRRRVLVLASAAIALFGLAFAPLFAAASPVATVAFLALGLALMGFTYGPLGAALAELFPTPVRYTGASLTFNLAGILGASLAPYAA